MKKLCLGLGLTFLFFGCSGAVSDEGEDADQGLAAEEVSEAPCPASSTWDDESHACVAEEDATDVGSLALVDDPERLNLAELRGLSAPRSSAAVTCTSLGTSMEGTWYRPNKLMVKRTVELQTHVLVHPKSIHNTTPCPIYATATNSTNEGVEVVFASYGSQAPELAIFDWSCSRESPCAGGHTDERWVWSRKISDLTCHVKLASDGERYVYYSNKSQRLDDPAKHGTPHWVNTVSLYNYCSKKWNRVYSHAFHHANPAHDGYKWGPVIEPHIQGAMPLVAELGFSGSSLRFDGKVSSLANDSTLFSSPAANGIDNWKVLSRTPNRSFKVRGCVPRYMPPVSGFECCSGRAAYQGSQLLCQ